jgi:hypothetical protein
VFCDDNNDNGDNDKDINLLLLQHGMGDVIVPDEVAVMTAAMKPNLTRTSRYPCRN